MTRQQSGQLNESPFDLCSEFRKFELSGDEAFMLSDSTVIQVKYYNERLKRKCPKLFQQ